MYALNQYFFYRGCETWATHARTPLPFTAQPTLMSGDKECECQNCWHERPPSTTQRLSRIPAPIAIITSSLQRPDQAQSSEDEDLPPLEEILTLHPPEDLSPLEEILTLQPPEDFSPLEEIPCHIQVTLAHTPATPALTLATPSATPAPRLAAPPATPSTPVTTPTIVQTERRALRGATCPSYTTT